MIKTLLNHIHRQLPTLTEVKFEDKSNIECATDSEIEKKRNQFISDSIVLFLDSI